MQRWSLRFGFQAIVSLADSVVSGAHLSFLQPLQLFLLRGQGLNRQALAQALDGLCTPVGPVSPVEWGQPKITKSFISIYFYTIIIINKNQATQVSP